MMLGRHGTGNIEKPDAMGSATLTHPTLAGKGPYAATSKVDNLVWPDN